MSHQEAHAVNLDQRRARNEEGTFRYAGRVAVVLGVGAAVLAGITQPFGSQTEIERQTGTITGFEKLDKQVVAGVHIDTSTTSKKFGTIFGKKIPTSWVGMKTDAVVHANVCQNGEDVEYSYSGRTDVTSVTVEAKDMCYLMVVPPESKKTSAVDKGLAVIPADTIIQGIESIGAEFGIDKESPRDTMADFFTKTNDYSNLAAAYECMPLAYESFTRERFIQVNQGLFRRIAEAVDGQGGEFDPDKVEVHLPETIPVPDNIYADKLNELDGEDDIDVVKEGGDCEITEEAELEAVKLLKPENMEEVG